MATANQMRAAARDAMRDGAVVITAAEFSSPGVLSKVQLYFFDEKSAVMDYVDKDDLLDNWPEEGVFVLNPSGDEKNAILPVGTWYDEENDNEYIRVPETDEPCDELVEGLPCVSFMDAVEQICGLKAE
ncbi:MAG: hypothetical protein J6S24_10575 [Lentisphaeria bacterium]|nr:hypothetical protein [Lentisphaerota bacterium]MBO5644112.1 hypothetical protein [Lentisphaeria bacterium]MBO5766725.1 hypothetical protein [Lentisphaeria bacterium]MBO5992481.1 hypothetical protein [Lentisphaeria bacterium]MBR2631972.1 hypothetical protein [Lentisphaeria bacterium]